MDIEKEAKLYAQQHIGGMQPVLTVGEKVEAAYIAGATRKLDDAEQETAARILVEELYGPGAPEGWQLDNAYAALRRISAAGIFG